MRNKVLLFLLLLGGLSIQHGFAAPPACDSVMTDAESRARTAQKTIFLHFSASWCGWCKRLEAYLDRADVKPVFDKYFVSVKLVTQEDAKHKDLENPGSDTWMGKIGGPGGLPFYAFLDEKGALLINSKRIPPEGGAGLNIGFPSESSEIDWFVKMLKKAAPAMTPADLKILEGALRNPKSVSAH